MLALEHQGASVRPAPKLDVFVAAAGKDFEMPAFRLANDLRARGISARMDFGNGRSLKKQFEQADKWHARYVVILGQSETDPASVIVKDMQTGLQKTVARGAVVEEIESAGSN